MASKLKKAERINFQSIVDSISERQKSSAQSIIQRRLEQYVAPFVSDIQFGLVVEDSGNDITFWITPLDNIANTNVAGDGVTSAQIVNWLNNGTSIRFAVFPEGYTQGTSPGSLGSSRPSGTEEGYIDFDNAENGITPRRFLEAVMEENSGLIIRRITDRLQNIRV